MNSYENTRLRVGPEITDVAGAPADGRQMLRLVNRYLWSRDYCTGRVVVEVACGTGQGLGLLANAARFVVGGDYSRDNLAIARRTYDRRMPLLRLDAQHLPLRDGSVDVVLLLETLYFLPSAEAFLLEARRVLRPGGVLLLSVINKDCQDFNPSPLYHRFFGAVELEAATMSAGFERPRLYGLLPMRHPPTRERLLRPLKRLAIRLRLVPRTMRGRTWLKRVFFGRLVHLPFVVEEHSGPRLPTCEVPGDVPNDEYQVLLAAASPTCVDPQ